MTTNNVQQNPGMSEPTDLSAVNNLNAITTSGYEIVIIDPLANDEDMDFNEKLFKELKKLNRESRGIKDDE
jgi:endo-alpha-1,4-polygalactosaminidase (GH114 family)